MAPIHDYASAGSREDVERELERDPSLRDAEDERYGRTPLTRAAEVGAANVVQYLVDQGAAVDHYDRAARTPLIVASSWGRLDVVTLLLRSGADATATDAMRMNSLMTSAFHGHAGVVDALLAWCGAAGECVDIDARDENGETALWLAVYDGHYQVIERLLMAGADPFLQDDYRRDVFSLARRDSPMPCLHDWALEFVLRRTRGIYATACTAGYPSSHAHNSGPLSVLHTTDSQNGHRSSQRSLREEVTVQECVKARLARGRARMPYVVVGEGMRLSTTDRRKLRWGMDSDTGHGGGGPAVACLVVKQAVMSLPPELFMELCECLRDSHCNASLAAHSTVSHNTDVQKVCQEPVHIGV